MGSSLTGSAPKASFSTQPTILPPQQQLLEQLVGLLGGNNAQPTSYTGSFAAPLNNLQNTSLAGLEQIAMGGTAPGTQPAVSKTPAQTSAIDQGFNALTSALDFKAPTIDSTAAFQQGVVDPLTENFTSKVLPSLDARFAGSAGGAYSSGRQQSNLTAADDLTRTLGQQGSTFAYNTATANQQAALSANQQRLAALGLTPGLTALPTTLDTSIANTNAGLTNDRINQLIATLGGGAVPYNVAQTQLSGQYGEFGRQQQQIQQQLADMIAAALGTSQTTIGVGTGGSTGLLGGLLGSPALGTGVTALLSDARAKREVEQIGDVAGIPLYRYKYIGDDRSRVGFIAQEVERHVPQAVGRVPGTDLRTVDYNVIVDLLEAA